MWESTKSKILTAAAVLSALVVLFSFMGIDQPRPAWKSELDDVAVEVIAVETELVSEQLNRYGNEELQTVMMEQQTAIALQERGIPENEILERTQVYRERQKRIQDERFMAERRQEVLIERMSEYKK